jgi:hypothetical protein
MGLIISVISREIYPFQSWIVDADVPMACRADGKKAQESLAFLDWQWFSSLFPRIA